MRFSFALNKYLISEAIFEPKEPISIADIKEELEFILMFNEPHKANIGRFLLQEGLINKDFTLTDKGHRFLKLSDI